MLTGAQQQWGSSTNDVCSAAAILDSFDLISGIAHKRASNSCQANTCEACHILQHLFMSIIAGKRMQVLRLAYVSVYGIAGNRAWVYHAATSEPDTAQGQRIMEQM